MSVTIYEHYNYTGYYAYFPDPAYTADLSNYAMGDYGDTWNNDISSLYTSTALIVYEDTGFGGDYAVLGPEYHDLDSLAAYGIENNDIGSFAHAAV